MPEIDDQLGRFTAGIVQRLGPPRPGAEDRLAPDRLRVIKGVPGGLDAVCVATPAEIVVLMGAELFPLSMQYTAAVATFMLPTEPGGTRPSPQWPAARDALAATLAGRGPEIALTPHQATPARAFGVYLYRFAVCRQLAHVVAEHIQRPTTGDPRALAVLRPSPNQELTADAMAVGLQARSIPDASQLVTALSSAAYFASLLAALPSPPPPAPALRIATCAAAADQLHRGGGEGVQRVYDSLAAVNAAVLGGSAPPDDACAEVAEEPTEANETP